MSGPRFRFQKLDVWNRAIDFGDLIHDETMNFPSDERFGLTSQIRRAALSISSNIAEGSGRTSDQDFVRFLEIAYGSLMEVISQIEFSHRRNLIDLRRKDELFHEAEILAKQLSGLRRSLKRLKHTPPGP